MQFASRAEAGQKLAEKLVGRIHEAAVVLALPRGGVPVAAAIARVLRAPLDLILVRKIGAPMQPELAVGAVVDGGNPIIVRNDEVIRMTGTRPAAFDAICREELAEIERRRARYLGGRLPEALTGRIAIVVDDGIATGATMRAALRAVRQRQPRKIVLAVPVAPPDAIAALRNEADEIVCLDAPDDFTAVGSFYRDFPQLSDADVTALLAQHARAPSSSASP